MQVKKFIQHLKQLQKDLEKRKKEAYPFDKDIKNPDYIYCKAHVDGYLEGELSMINRVISLLYLYSSPSDKINKEE